MEKKKILIVEDEFHIANAQKMVLDNEFTVEIASDGEDGLKKAKEMKPDLVVLDIMLPKMSGYEVCKKIRKDPNLKTAKIVMVTAKDQEKDEAKGMDLGADDYICKPFEANELKHVINQVLKY